MDEFISMVSIMLGIIIGMFLFIFLLDVSFPWLISKTWKFDYKGYQIKVVQRGSFTKHQEIYINGQLFTEKIIRCDEPHTKLEIPICANIGSEKIEVYIYRKSLGTTSVLKCKAKVNEEIIYDSDCDVKDMDNIVYKTLGVICILIAFSNEATWEYIEKSYEFLKGLF